MRIFTSRDSGSNDRGAFFKRKERECLVVFLGSIRIDWAMRWSYNFKRSNYARSLYEIGRVGCVVIRWVVQGGVVNAGLFRISAAPSVTRWCWNGTHVLDSCLLRLTTIGEIRNSESFAQYGADVEARGFVVRLERTCCDSYTLDSWTATCIVAPIVVMLQIHFLRQLMLAGRGSLYSQQRKCMWA